MGSLLIAIAIVSIGQCGGYSAASYSYATPTYSYATPVYNTVTYVPYVQAVKFVAVEPSYGCGDLYPSLVAGELRAARRYEAAERQAAVLDRLESALGRMATSAPAPAQASYAYRSTYQAAAYPPATPSGQYEAPPPSYPAPQVPAKTPPPSYPAPQVPAKAPPPSYPAPQVPAKAPPLSYPAPQVPAKVPPPSYSAPQVPAKVGGSAPGEVAPPVVPAFDEPRLSAALSGAEVLVARCTQCHTRGTLKGNSFTIFDAPSRLVTLTTAQAGEMIARVEAGEMPPTGPLPPEEVAAIRSYLTDRSGAIAGN